MKDAKFVIPQWALDAAIEGLQALARRLETEAAALAQMNTPASLALAEKRLQQARDIWKGHEFYIHL